MNAEELRPDVSDFLRGIMDNHLFIKAYFQDDDEITVGVDLDIASHNNLFGKELDSILYDINKVGGRRKIRLELQIDHPRHLKELLQQLAGATAGKDYVRMSGDDVYMLMHRLYPKTIEGSAEEFNV